MIYMAVLSLCFYCIDFVCTLSCIYVYATYVIVVEVNKFLHCTTDNDKGPMIEKYISYSRPQCCHSSCWKVSLNYWVCSVMMIKCGSSDDIKSLGTLLLTWFDFNPAWIRNHMSSKVWDQIIHPFPNFNSATVDVWELISNFIPHFIMDVINYPCWHLWAINQRIQ